MMKHVGEAVKEQAITFGSEDKVNVIGIATWGIVDRKDSLIAPKVNIPLLFYQAKIPVAA